MRVTGFTEFERRFGGLSAQSPLAYAVHQFFGNGGSVAVIVRVARAGSGKSACVVLESTDGRSESHVLEVHAKEPGVWGNSLRVAVDYDTTCPDETFNLRVHDARGDARESFTGLSMDAGSGTYAPTVINAGSRLIRVDAVGEGRPDPSGTVSKPFGHELPDLAVDVTVKIGDVEREFKLFDADCDGEVPTSVAELALLLERKLRALPDAPGRHAFAGVEVTAFGRRLQVVAGSTDPEDAVRFLGECANDLGLEASVNPPVFPLEGGEDGEAPGPRDLIGSEADKTGIQALRGVADVNLLSLPELASYEKTEDALTVVSAAQRLCEERRIFLLVDAPATWVSVDSARAGLSAFDAVRGNHAGLYFPHLQLTDPLTGRLRAFPPSGAVAGVIARTDSERGVWKAPAGTEAQLVGVRSLTVELTDRETGLLNPLGVNCLRTFPWPARWCGARARWRAPTPSTARGSTCLCGGSRCMWRRASNAGCSGSCSSPTTRACGSRSGCPPPRTCTRSSARAPSRAAPRGRRTSSSATARPRRTRTWRTGSSTCSSVSRRSVRPSSWSSRSSRRPGSSLSSGPGSRES